MFIFDLKRTKMYNVTQIPIKSTGCIINDVIRLQKERKNRKLQ